jgi:uncharacterized membrane protein
MSVNIPPHLLRFGENVNQPAVNIPPSERWLSVFGGSALTIWSLAKRGSAAIPALLGSGYLLYRGVTGHDSLYNALNINRAGTGRRTVTVQKSVTVNKPVDEVYRFWQEYEYLPRCMRRVQEAHAETEGLGHALARLFNKAGLEWDAEAVAERENHSVTFQSNPEAGVPHNGAVYFLEAPDGRGTDVRLYLEYVPTGLTAVLTKLFYEVTAQQLKETLRRFKQIMETGEFPTNDGQPSGRAAAEEQEESVEEQPKWQTSGAQDLVEEAAWESFPASDPPSFNPGREEA